MPEAEKYFDEAVNVFGPRIELFNAVLSAYARLNLFPEALKLLDRIPHEGFEVIDKRASVSRCICFSSSSFLLPLYYYIIRAEVSQFLLSIFIA